MTFPAQVFRVLIASPSDLSEERDAATDVITAWNAQHAAAEGIVLLPVRWETHARPQNAVRPQQAINEQLVAKCDILLGMFWTRLGTSTGIAESGTVEEIDQFIADAKPALLYFSRRPIDPAKIDTKQHLKLKAFKKQTLKARDSGFDAVSKLDDGRWGYAQALELEEAPGAQPRLRIRWLMHITLGDEDLVEPGLSSEKFTVTKDGKWNFDPICQHIFERLRDGLLATNANDERRKFGFV